MQIEVIKEKRRTLALRINPEGNVVLKVPIRFSDHKIDEFLYSKRKWISDKLNFMKEQEEKAKNHVDSDYESEFADKVLPIVREIGDKFGLKSKCSRVESMKSKQKWGTFDHFGRMKLNYKLCALPRELIEYIIIHEYCHAFEMNHSEKFWNYVGQFDKEYKQHRKELKQHSFLLRNVPKVHLKKEGE